MPSDLPDYTRLVTVNVNIPDVEVGPVNVGRYVAAPSDLPDGTRTALITDIKGRLIVVQHEKDRTVETEAGKYVRVKGHASDEVPVTFADQEIIPRPKGGVHEKGSETTTNVYATIVSHVPADGKQFQLAKILISCDQDVMYKLRWAAADISIEVYVPAKTPFPDWFPWDYYTMTGDGSKAFEVQVKYPSGGYAGTCNVEIVGEDV